jgi:hypothetical protein
MANMSDYLKQLEAHDDLEAEVIKKTKVHKVLKAIIKLNSIPKEDEYSFKQRSSDLLTKWGGALAADAEPATEPATNGIKHDEDEKSEPTKRESSVEKKDDLPMKEKKEDTPAEPASATNAADGDGDVSMEDVDKDTSKSELAADAEAASSTEISTEVATGTETASVAVDTATS